MGVHCWASSLGDCCSTQSREHYITKGLFDGPLVTLRGFSFCKVDEITVGLASAASKILCRTHNERLSVLDQEAIRTFASLRNIELLREKQTALARIAPRVWKVRTWEINGRLLERWFLKTLVNLVHVQADTMDWPNGSDRLPTPDVVEACFGLRPILSPRGLLVAGAVGHTVDPHDYVGFAPIRDKSANALAGGAFEFRGFRFVLSWTERNLEPFVAQLDEVDSGFAGWREAALVPFRSMVFSVGGYRAQELVVKWPQFKPSQY